MTTPPHSDVAEIAAGMSEAMKRQLCNTDKTLGGTIVVFVRDRRTERALENRNLIATDFEKHGFAWRLVTELGLAVRDHLISQETDHGTSR